jgi:hypothetical protein
LNDLIKKLKEKNEDVSLKYEEYLSSDRELTTVKDSIILLNSEISKTQDEIARIVSENSASVYRVKKENLYSLSGSIQKTMDSTKKIPLGETKS